MYNLTSDAGRPLNGRFGEVVEPLPSRGSTRHAILVEGSTTPVLVDKTNLLLYR